MLVFLQFISGFIGITIYNAAFFSSGKFIKLSARKGLIERQK